jgi:hypothetical protein
VRETVVAVEGAASAAVERVRHGRAAALAAEQPAQERPVFVADLRASRPPVRGAAGPPRRTTGGPRLNRSPTTQTATLDLRALALPSTGLARRCPGRCSRCEASARPVSMPRAI